MSLTSYRAAPPRATSDRLRQPESENANAAPRRRDEIDKEGIVLGWSGNDLLSRVLRHSTIGAEAFNGRVRDGIGFRRLAQITGPAKDKWQANNMVYSDCGPRTWTMRAIKPIERLVLVSSTRCRACTPSLSTWSSSTALKGELVSRWVSRLDAFSGYPVHT